MAGRLRSTTRVDVLCILPVQPSSMAGIDVFLPETTSTSVGVTSVGGEGVEVGCDEVGFPPGVPPHDLPPRPLSPISLPPPPPVPVYPWEEFVDPPVELN